MQPAVLVPCPLGAALRWYPPALRFAASASHPRHLFPPPPRAPCLPSRPCSYLGLQDVPRTADHAPSRTFYTWRVNVDSAMARLSSDLYRAAGNLHARLEHELGKQRELLDLLDLPKVGPSVKERREDEVAALRAVTGRLEASLLELDHQLCIFADV